MTADELRQDADRREALARAALAADGYSPPWQAGDTDDGEAAVVWGCRNGRQYQEVTCEVPCEVAAHIAANSPAAVLAQCERDRLLAEIIEAAGDWCCDITSDDTHRRALLTSFAALGDSNE